MCSNTSSSSAKVGAARPGLQTHKGRILHRRPDGQNIHTFKIQLDPMSAHRGIQPDAAGLQRVEDQGVTPKQHMIEREACFPLQKLIAAAAQNQSGGPIHQGTGRRFRLREGDPIILKGFPLRQRHRKGRMPANDKGHDPFPGIRHLVPGRQGPALQLIPDLQTEIIGILLLGLRRGTVSVTQKIIPLPRQLELRPTRQPVLGQTDLPSGADRRSSRSLPIIGNRVGARYPQ